MKKKFLAVLFFALLALLAFTACINEDALDTPPQGQETAHTHTFGEWTTVKEATCTEDGKMRRVCQCGFEETNVVSSVGHTLEDWIVTKNESCTESGEKQRSCLVCCELFEETIPATGHLFVNLVCTVCGEKNYDEEHFREWQTLKSEIETLLANANNVHYFSDPEIDPNFENVKSAFDSYVLKYYSLRDFYYDTSNNQVVGFGIFGEETLASDFFSEYERYNELYAKRQAATDAIVNQIKTLGEVTPDTAEAVLAAISDINVAIESYEATYCDDGCLFGDNLFILYRTTKLAEFAKTCKDAYAYADDAGETAKVENAWNNGRAWIESSNDVSFVDFSYGFANSTIEDIMEQIKS